MKIIRRSMLFLIVAALAFVQMGCAFQKVEKVKVDEVKAYSDQAVEKIFKGISEENYNLFTEDFDTTMKSALTQEKFKEIINQLGKFETMEILAADRVEGYTRVYYKTRFSKFSRDVTFTVVFSKEGDKKVSGLFYK